MKFMVALLAMAAVASAQYLGESGTIVEGSKAILQGPSGTINADTGAIIKPDTRSYIPTAAALPLPALSYARSYYGYDTPALYPRSFIRPATTFGYRGLYDGLYY